jgi:glycosyltransferase involved in cell wall biosynthesis
LLRPGSTASATETDAVIGALTAGQDLSRRPLSADEFLGLPPAEFVASVYAALFRRLPDAATFLAQRDRLLLGEITEVGLLAEWQATSGTTLAGLSSARRKDRALGSPPAQLALGASRLARNIARLPRNLRRKTAASKAPPPALRHVTHADLARPRIAVVAPASAGGEAGGAERFYLGLCRALEDAGLAAELVAPQAREDNFSDILRSYHLFSELDLSAFDGVISTKAPSYAIHHPNHVCYLVHTMRGWYDMFSASHPFASAQTRERRHMLQALDTGFLQQPRALFAIGEEVSERLRRFNGLNAQTLHFPGNLAGLGPGPYTHLLMPGRLHPWKRVDLAIRAMRFVRAPIPLVIAGTGQEESALRALAKGDPRIRFTGRVSDQELAALYADSLAILFLPRQEDLGLITLEAFGCEKPVICCSDSGEPARMVRDRKSGFVCDPDPRQIARRIEALAQNPARAEAMGKMGAESIAQISWGQVAASLRTALGL